MEVKQIRLKKRQMFDFKVGGPAHIQVVRVGGGVYQIRVEPIVQGTVPKAAGDVDIPGPNTASEVAGEPEKKRGRK